ncbi:MAG: hypothetical protein HW416_2283, partial [Chloroflexi bacterium]|nr:hypothetical protein [Chloroflexota bacterium]
MLNISSLPSFARFLVPLLICSLLVPTPVIGQDELLQ